MNNLNIGKLITTPQQRDAVHMAVAPVIAGEFINPGQHIGVIDGKAFLVRKKLRGIGVADPFLTTPAIARGETFWLFLYPGSITSLRHEWEHPAFTTTEKRSFSEEWLRRYAILHNPYIKDNEEAYKHLIEGLKSREVFYRGEDLHGLYELEDAHDLKDHAEKVLGINIDWDNFTFTCSC